MKKQEAEEAQRLSEFLSQEFLDPPMTEFEMHAFLYEELRKSGVRIRGELHLPVGIPDLVIFDDDGRIARLVELKRSMGTAVCEDQILRYEELGVPVDIVCGLKGVRMYLEVFSLGMSQFRPRRIRKKKNLCPLRM